MVEAVLYIICSGLSEQYECVYNYTDSKQSAGKKIQYTHSEFFFVKFVSADHTEEYT